LSGGQIQRMGLARTLFKKPQILVLDEFTSSSDKENKKLIVNSLTQIKKNENKYYNDFSRSILQIIL